MCMEVGAMEQVSRPCVCIAVKRGKGGGGDGCGRRAFQLSLLTTLMFVWKLLSGVRVVYVLGWEPLVPDCRAVREPRLSRKQDYTTTLWTYIK